MADSNQLDGGVAVQPQVRRQATHWHWDKEAELIRAHSIKDAVIDWWEHDYPEPPPKQETVTVYGYAPMVVTRSSEYLASIAIEWMMEALDDEYAHPDCDEPEPTPAMRQAATALAETVLRDYTPTMLEIVEEREVRVADYVPPAA